MIKITSNRTRDNEPPSKPFIHESTKEKATSHFIEFELAYGGQVIDLSETKVIVRTVVLDCVDLTTFEGSKEEMILIVEAAYVSVSFTIQSDNILQSFKDMIINKIMEITKGNPLLIKLSSDIISGKCSIRVILLTILNSDKYFTMLSGCSVKDLVSVLCLVKFDKVEISDAVQLLN